MRKVPCDCEDKIGADQIFPLLKTIQWYTPTIKHKCPRTLVSSSLRACSNKVGFDDIEFKKYEKWFRTIYIKEFLKYMDEELLEVDTKVWLNKYPINYRNKLLKAVDHNNISFKIQEEYDAFVKQELQFTTVPHELKDTNLNDVKERQICSPCDEKKVFGNAFINLLEGVASRRMKSYCGRSNWIQICHDLDMYELDNRKFIFGDSDGSGFDMTQYPECNNLMNELLIKCAKHPNVTWNEGQDIDKFIQVLRQSMYLKVNVANGDLKYKAVGRASGDGWTTFCNTLLMISYWRYTFYRANINEFCLKVKGDDVLFGFSPTNKSAFDIAVSRVFTMYKHKHNHGLGQICKQIHFGELTDLQFLSNEFFRTDNGNLRMTRIPARVLQTMSWTTKLPENGGIKHRRELLYSKGMCLKSWADGLPIFSVLADKMIELGLEGKLRDYNEYADADRTWHKNRDDYKAYLFYLSEKYYITENEVRAVEERIKNIKTLTGVIELPELEKFYTPFTNQN